MKQKDLNNFPFDIHIAALKSAMPSYSLAWHINQVFFMDFEMSINWEKNNQHGEIGYFTHFFYQFEDVELNWHLIDNRGTNAYFLQTKPMFDFYLICVGEDIYDYFSKAIESLQSSNKIENVFKFSPSHIKNIDVIYKNITKTKEFIKDLHV